MKCPKCQSNLQPKDYKGIPADVCEKCEGVWLDVEELDRLEDQVMDDDTLKSSVMLESFPTELKCPHCEKQLKSFNYRMYDEVTLDYCPDKHGWFLDEGEADKVKELMQAEENDVNRIKKIEKEWIGDLWRLKNPSFMYKLTDLFS